MIRACMIALRLFVSFSSFFLLVLVTIIAFFFSPDLDQDDVPENFLDEPELFRDASFNAAGGGVDDDPCVHDYLCFFFVLFCSSSHRHHCIHVAHSFRSGYRGWPWSY